MGSLSFHYTNVARELQLEGSGGADVSMSSIWTLAEKGWRGEIVTLVIYCAIVAAVWFFRKGLNILRWWVLLPKEATVFLSPGNVETVKWTGRIIFSALVAILLLYRGGDVLRKE